MPIEIKELTIRITLTENNHSSDKQANTISKSLKKEIINDCVEKVLQKIQKQMDR
jgi:Family of unknown function (DUF5908)